MKRERIGISNFGLRDFEFEDGEGGSGISDCEISNFEFLGKKLGTEVVGDEVLMQN